MTIFSFRTPSGSSNVQQAYAALHPLFNGVNKGESYLGGIASAALSGVRTGLGIKSALPPSNAAEDLARNLASSGLGNGLTADEQAKIETKKSLLATLRKNPDSADRVLGQQVKAGSLSEREAGLLAKRVGNANRSG